MAVNTAFCGDTDSDIVSNGTSQKIQDSQQITTSIYNAVINGHSDEQTEVKDGPWTTQLSRKILPIEGADVGGSLRPEEETKRRWHLKPRLKKQILLVVLAYSTMVVSYGYIMALGVLFLPIRETFSASRASTALLQSVSLGSLLCGSAIASPLMIRFGPGPVGFVGTLIATTGLVGSFLAPSLSVLILSGGFLTGCGLCSQYVINLSMVGMVIRDDKWRDVALTFIASAAGTGFSLFPILTAYLLDVFGWRGTMLLLGSLTLQCCPAFLLIATISRDLIKRNRKLEDNTTRTSHWNLSLFKEFGFLVVGFSVFLIMALIPTVNFFLVDISKSKGFDVTTGSFFLSMAGFTSLVGRITCVVMTALKKGSKLIVIGILFVSTGVCMTLLPFAKTYEWMVVAVTLYNVPFGAQSVIFPSVIYEMAGIERYSSAVGYTGLIGGVAALISGPIGGTIKDITGSYDGVIFMAVFGCLSCAFCFFTLYAHRRQKNKNNTTVENQTVSTYL